MTFLDITALMSSLNKSKLSDLPLAELLQPWTVVGCGLVLILTVAAWRRFFSPLKNIPGPFWASITRLWYLKILIAGKQNEHLKRAHEKYGQFVRMAPNEVSVTHPDAVKKLYLQPLQKGLFYEITSLPDWRFQTPMSTRDPKAKIERSKAFSSGYSLSAVVQYEEAISRTIEKLIGWLDKHASSGAPMSLDHFISFTTSDVVGEILFSKEFGFLDSGRDVGNSLRNNEIFIKLISLLGQFRWTQLLLCNPLITMAGVLPLGINMQTAMESLNKRQKDPDARFDIVAHWLRYLEQHPDRTMFRNVQTQTAANIGAGSDTVSCGLQSTLYYMVRHPETWARARAEITAAVRAGLCQGKVVSFSDAQQLPYLQACINEGLRINSPVPMCLPRIAPAGGVEIGGLFFPQGTTLSVNPWVFHRNKEIWGHDADEFKPERWLVADASKLERYWMPFGIGYNSCPGQNIARMELTKICSTVVRDYDFKLVDEAKPWQMCAFFTMVPTDWPVFVTKSRGE